MTLRLLILMLMSCSVDVLAIEIFHSRDAFIEALDGSVQSENFESLDPGVLSDGTLSIAFGLATDGPDDLAVVADYLASSGVQQLGADNVDASINGLDTLTFTFDQTVDAFGLYIITEELLAAGDFSLTNITISVANNNVADIVLADGQAYFIGFKLDDAEEGVDSIELKTINANLDFNYNLDDVSFTLKSTSSSSSSSSTSTSTSSSSSTSTSSSSSTSTSSSSSASTSSSTSTSSSSSTSTSSSSSSSSASSTSSSSSGGGNSGGGAMGVWVFLLLLLLKVKIKAGQRRN